MSQDARNYVLTSSDCGATVNDAGKIVQANQDPTLYEQWLVVFNNENVCGFNTAPATGGIRARQVCQPSYRFLFDHETLAARKASGLTH